MMIEKEISVPLRKNRIFFIQEKPGKLYGGVVLPENSNVPHCPNCNIMPRIKISAEPIDDEFELSIACVQCGLTPEKTCKLYAANIIMKKSKGSNIFENKTIQQLLTYWANWCKLTNKLKW